MKKFTLVWEKRGMPEGTKTRTFEIEVSGNDVPDIIFLENTWLVKMGLYLDGQGKNYGYLKATVARQGNVFPDAEILIAKETENNYC